MTINKFLHQYNNSAESFIIARDNAKNIDTKKFYSHFENSYTGKSILDLGCGDGSDFFFYKKYSTQLYGIDISSKMITLAKNKFPQGNFSIGDYRKTPYIDKSFEIVVSKYAFQITKDILSIYKEIYRILKKDGIFIFLATHPIRQFIEKKQAKKNYFKKEIVFSSILNSQIIVQEPSHTIEEYLNKYFLDHFRILSFQEHHDPCAENIENDIYPGFMIIKAQKI